MFKKILLLIGVIWSSMGILHSQDRGTEILTGVKGREILQELQLREAEAISQKKAGKEWAIKPDLASMVRNPFSKLGSAEISSSAAASKLRGIDTQVLFEELRLRSIRDKGITGLDDRQDLFRLENRREEVKSNGGDCSFFDGALDNAQAVCCVVNDRNLVRTPSQDLAMITTPFSSSLHDVLKLCPMERFYSQPTGSFCTGFLVGSDIVVTAGHCISPSTLGNTRFVFGYRMTDESVAVTKFSHEQVYSGAVIVAHQLNKQTGEDWAIVRLDRPVVNVKPVKFRNDGRISDREEVYVIGYPSGLPCKISDNASVRDNSESLVFKANLDTYGGNSGSPVFNRVTHEVEGVLVRGGEDFEFVTDSSSGCIRSVVITDSQGREECTRSTIWAASVPMSP